MASFMIGAQLYSVRQSLQDAESVARTFEKVAKIGYKTAQVSGLGKDVDYRDVAKASRDSGVSICCTHMAWTRFREELDEVIEIHKAWDCKHPAVGSLPAEYMDLDGIRRFGDELAPVAEKLAAAGMDFSFHNHNRELVRYEGKPWLAHLYDEIPAEHLKAEIDTYWIAAGGGDPAQWIRRCAGRQPLTHLKDMMITPERELRFAPIGEGNLNWEAIVDACNASGVEYALVEQDNCYGEDPFECLATSYRNLRAMGLS